MTTDSHRSQELKSLLIKYWGYSAFRPSQEEIINAVLDGRDTLALLPTGGGKSICYQVPALARDGVCIVVSPLIALMKDQVTRLRQRGINAISIVSGMNKYEVDVALDNCVYGKVKLLYLSPERLENELVRTRIGKMNVNLLAVDEAHCISQWGYDFRPSYMNIAGLREVIPGTPVLAVTATATPGVREDIAAKLHFKDHRVIVRSFERKNLSYVVIHEEAKLNRLVQVLKSTAGSAIVYVRSRKKTRETAEFLASKQISAAYYHAGLSTEVRSSRQEDWMRGKTRVICCTNAFGMGIDKPDVSIVVHLEMPDNLESYFQEAGRAGRDEKKAYSVILYSEHDSLELKHRYQTSFPPLDNIRSVFQHIANYCKLAEGAGQGAAFDFDIGAFCETFKLRTLNVYNCLHILELEGIIALTDAVHLPSRAHFTCQLNDLYQFQVKNPRFDAFIKAMLRSYEGLFDDFVRISESDLARRCSIPAAYAARMLRELETFGLIKYLPQKKSPQLIFLRPREKADKLAISTENLLERKKRFKKRMAHMISYVTRKDQCRSRMLLDYFGEHDNFRCGNCDVCLERNKLKLSDLEYSKLMNEIDHLLSGGGIPYDQLVAEIKGVKNDKALLAVRWLIDNQLLECSPELIITARPHET